ncbi:MAG: hypothetical protein IEMM0002_1439 [bacterium]|nr:MAG: hypothetical protein IEMM0002_1439 [bacterium]
MRKSAKLSVIINPASGGGKGVSLYKKVNDAIKSDPSLRRNIAHVEYTHPEKEQGHYKKIIGSSRIILICGGDGTVHRLVNLLKKSSYNGSIAIFPMGTGNDLVRTLGVFEKDVIGFMRKLIGKPRKVNLDVFSLNAKVFFTNYVSFGIDAWVVSKYEKTVNALNGSPIYKLPFLKYIIYATLGMYALLFYDKKLREAKSGQPCAVIILNGLKTYAGGSVYCENSSINDRKIELSYFPAKLDYLKLILNRTKLYRPAHAAESMDTPLVLRFHIITTTTTQDAPVEIAGEDYTAFFKGCREFTVSYAGSIEVCI